jgi:hypothetical protein
MWLTSDSIGAQLFINFMIGGTIIASVSYLATFVNPLIASIWWCYPISLIPSIYFMKSNGKTNEYISKFLLSTTFALFLLFGSTYAMSYYIKRSPDLFMPILKSTGWWILGSVIFFVAVMKSGYKNYFL